MPDNPPPPLPRRVFITKMVTNLFKPILSVGSTPGGCTKYIQAQDVSWNKPFKVHVTEQYDDWFGNGIHEYTAGRNMKPAPRRRVVELILNSWKSMPVELIAK